MLKNTYAKLKEGKEVNIAYFGGSITEGAGSTDKKSKGWRSLTTNWIRDTYPNSKITEINATIGGTGSKPAIFRLEEDVLQYAPDLLFIEFMTNDSEMPGCEQYEEAIIRQTMKNSPTTDIVLVLTCTQRIYEKMLRDEYPDSYHSYHVLSKHYNIPLLDIGEEINTRVRSNEGNYMTYTKDSVHPNNLGHTLLANAAIQFLKTELELPFPIHHEKYNSARIIDAKDVLDTDFKYVDKPFIGENGQRGFGYLIASGAGHHIKISFTGTTVGIIYMTARNSGNIKWSVDNGEFETKCFWDEYALRFDRINYKLFATDLEFGSHTFEIITTGEHDVQSEGDEIIISSILVA